MIGRGSFGGYERNRDNRDDDSEGNYVKVLALAVDRGCSRALSMSFLKFS